MPTKKQERIKRRLDRRQGKVDESRATFGTNDPDLGKFDRRLNRLKRTVNKAEKQGMDVNYDTRNASGEGAVKTTTVKPKKGSATEGSKYGNSPAEMESAKQEKYNLLHDNPVAKHASWMSKFAGNSRMSPMKMGHSPAEMSPYKMNHDSPAKNLGHGMDDMSPEKGAHRDYHLKQRMSKKSKDSVN